MDSGEPPYAAADFELLIDRVAETGERVTLTGDGRPASVLLPAAELAELEYWARRYLGVLPPPGRAKERPPGPAQHGPYTQYVHADGVRMTFTRGRTVVAELYAAWSLEWLEAQAVQGRQGYMDPKQLAAFEEFLARQPPVGEP
ncbi:type II toxin-antitoxin system prevent-host-death family antitoxin [Streptomyces sp. NPDC059578]|uniref:type II toxin-antitoxin system prevent-host-death family antitoxin n=1 Tax=unclassified Streptomyces TaxID=2593676 RepID=UPI0036473670